MAIVSILLDPAAVVYTDDEIVGKVNTAADKITRADSVEVAAILESATEKLMSDTEKTKLAGIEDGADVNPADLDGVPDSVTRFAAVEANAKGDQSGAEIKTAYEAEENAYTDTKDTKLTGVEEGAEVNDADLAALDPTQNTKLNGIEALAEVNPDGGEIRDLVKGLADGERELVLTAPISGEHRVVSVEVDADLKLKADYDEAAES